MKFQNLLKVSSYIFWIYLIMIDTAFCFTTSDITISRTYNQYPIWGREVAQVMIEIENYENEALHGFYFTEQIPEGLTLVAGSVKLLSADMERDVNYHLEVGAPDEIYEHHTPYRWVLETPPTFFEGNEIPSNGMIEIIYFLTTKYDGDFYLSDYTWVGYYPEAPIDRRAAFGYSESEDMFEITFAETQVIADSDGDGMPDDWEVYYGLDPKLNDSLTDTDEDGLNNINEYLNGTDPSIADAPLNTGVDNTFLGAKLEDSVEGCFINSIGN